MSRHRLHKQKRQHRIEMMIQREIARAETIRDQNQEAMGVLSKALANEPKSLAKAFEKLEQKGDSK